MEYRELEVKVRSERGSAVMGRLRRSGLTPAVVYSGGSEAMPITVSSREFFLLGKKSVHTQLFRFKSAESFLDGRLALVKEVQTEPLKGTVLHIDFLAISEGHRISVAVPLKLVGDPLPVKEGRAMVNQGAYEVEIECLPTEIPEQIVVQIGHLREGQSLHASDLVLPEGAELVSKPELGVVSIVVEKKEEAAAETGEAASPEATPVVGEDEDKEKE